MSIKLNTNRSRLTIIMGFVVFTLGTLAIAPGIRNNLRSLQVIHRIAGSPAFVQGAYPASFASSSCEPSYQSSTSGGTSYLELVEGWQCGTLATSLPEIRRLDLEIYWIGHSQQVSGHMDSALREWKTLPILAVYFGKIGVMHFQNNQLEIAQRYLNLAAEISDRVSPERSNEYRIQCRLHLDLQEWGQAVTSCQKAVATSSNGSAYRLLGMAQFNAGRSSEAVESFTKYIDLYSAEIGRPYYWRSKAWEAEGNLDDAVKDLIEAISQEQDFVLGYVDLLRLYQQHNSVDCSRLQALLEMANTAGVLHNTSLKDLFAQVSETNDCEIPVAGETQ